jgi:arginine utilization protein RocB
VNEVLWTEVETAFQSAWKDTAKTQSAYDQLMKLQMKDLKVNTYNTTFERLAAAAKWEPDAKGTIAQYRAGLQENIHCLNCESRKPAYHDG